MVNRNNNNNNQAANNNAGPDHVQNRRNPANAPQAPEGNAAAAAAGAGGGAAAVDWVQEDLERYSFDDSDRFEEDSLCSWSSEPESLYNNWRGWKKPTNFGIGGNAATATSGAIGIDAPADGSGGRGSGK